MSIEEKRRAAFEDFAKRRGHTNFRCWGEAHGCTGCNDYEDDAVSQLFELWNAALDSVVIDLTGCQVVRFEGDPLGALNGDYIKRQGALAAINSATLKAMVTP